MASVWAPGILDVLNVIHLPSQDDADNRGLLNRRRYLLKSDDDDEYEVEDDDDDEGVDEDEDFDEDEQNLDPGKDNGRDIKAEEVAETARMAVEESSILRRRGADSLTGPLAESGATQSKTGNTSDDDRLNEEEEEDDERLKKHRKKHKKHKHKKHKHKKHKKKHKKDRQQCRYLEGLTRSVVKFGMSSGDYLSVSHGNNTCYQAVSHLYRRPCAVAQWACSLHR